MSEEVLVLPAFSPLPYAHTSTPEPQGNFVQLTIPLKHVQNLFLIEATINGVSGNFILDTGAPYLVLNKTYFRSGSSKTDLVASGISGKGGDVSTLTVKKLQVQELFYENVEADVTNLAQIENSKGVKILGLMGTNLFLQFEMEIDARRDLLILYKLNKNGERLVNSSIARIPDIVLPMLLVNNIVFIDGKIKEKPLRFCFDSGAEVNILSSNAPRKVIAEFKVLRRSVLLGAGGQRAEVLAGVVKQVDIGGHTFTAMQTYLTSISELQKVYASYFDGILGYPLLFNSVVSLNFKKKEFSMYLYKN